MGLSPALFLDRDGVINIDHGYVSRPEQFDWMPGIFDLVRAARSKGHRVVVVTNQAGIGRGYYTEDDFARLTAWMCERFAAEGAAIDRVYHCPSHPTAGIGLYRVDSPMRKPGPGMLLAARDDLALDLAASSFLGDKLSDMQAGLAAGVGHNLWLLAPEEQPELPAGVQAVRSLAEAQALLSAP
jgi:D-glycero-D-manno-heptose 1,7-bisphosphate phosphatase